MTGDAATILIVEDEPPIRRLLRATLGAHDHRTVEAATGAEALSAMRHHRPDLVLLDLGLPDIDGQALIGRIRELSPVPIVVLSSRGDEAAKVAALDAGADDYVTKPFGADELMARLRAALRHRLAQQGAERTFTSGDLSVDLVRLDAMHFCAAVKYVTSHPNCAARQSWRDSGSLQTPFCVRGLGQTARAGCWLRIHR